VAATLLAIGIHDARAEGVPQQLATKAMLDDLALEITKKTKTLISLGSAGGAGAGIVGSVVAALNDAPDSVLVALVAGTSVIVATGVSPWPA
jgi:hypothetical protein